MKVGGKTNLVDLPLFVWCMLTLALKDKISCMVLGTYYIFRMFVSQKIPSMKLWSKILQYLCIISRIEGVHYDKQSKREYFVPRGKINQIWDPRSHHVFVEQTNKKNWKKIHSYEIRRDLLLRRNVCNIQFCWSLTRDINNSYRGARTYSPEPSITLQNIHKSVINPSKIPRIFYTNWQNKNNITRAEKIRLQNDENHNNWFSKLP